MLTPLIAGSLVLSSRKALPNVPPALPVLHSKIDGKELHLKWETPDNLPFPMKVPLALGAEVQMVDIPEGGVTIPLSEGQKPVVDPDHWLLMKVSQ